MGSSAEPDRSLSSGISIPQWMKNRINDRYDIEETFSPPTHDDTFFYIRYPKSTKPAAPEPVKPVEVEAANTKPIQQDFSQHTLPCRQYIDANPMNTDTRGPFVVKPAPARVKPQDDEIVGDASACGPSVVAVAKQMISNKLLFQRGFSSSGSNEHLAVPPDNFDPAHRRGSRSLPASPLGSPSQSPSASPRVHRKAHPNRFFTGTYPVTERGEGSSNLGSWMWPGFLSKAQQPGNPSIHEEADSPTQEVQLPEKPLTSMLTAALAERSLGSSEASGASSIEEQKNIKLQPKPSELREMNFWSPTSM